MSRAMRSALVAGCLLICFICGARAQEGAYAPRDGDMIFQSFPHSDVTDAIEGASGSPYSHCGIIHRAVGGWVVIEAVGPVKETPLAEWIAQGRHGRYAVFRLKQSYVGGVPAFVRAAIGFEGLPYDIHYDMRNKSAMYCSGLLYESFLKAEGESLGQVQKLGDLNWKPYVAVIKKIERGNVPLDLELITPRAISEAPQVEKIYSNFR